MTRLTIIRILIIFCIPWLLLIASCKQREHTEDRWYGVPASVSLRCKWRDGVGICVGGGESYQCIRSREEDDRYTWDRYECARASTAVLPEREKGE